MGKEIGRVSVPTDICENIDDMTREAIYKYEVLHQGKRPKYIMLSRIGYGAIKIRWHTDLGRIVFGESPFPREFEGVTIICNPYQDKLIQCIGDSEDAFYYEGY